MINRPFVHLLPPFIRKFGMIPSSYLVAMTYEEQLLWLCKYCEDLGLEIENIKTALSNIRDEINNIYSALAGIEENFTILSNRINQKQDKLTAGENIFIENNIISSYLNSNRLMDTIQYDKYIDLSGNVGDTVDTTLLDGDNTACQYLEVLENEEFIVQGDYILVTTDDNLQIIRKFTPNPLNYETQKYKIEEGETKVIISWKDTNLFTPYLGIYTSADYILSKIEYLPSWINSETTETEFVNIVNSSSTNDEVPSALAVYTAIMDAIGGGQVISYTDLTDLPSINGETVTGALTSADLHLDYIKDINSSTNIWELDTGLYKVSSGTTLYYGTDGTSFDEYTTNNEYSYLYVGKYNSSHYNFMIFDKEASLVGYKPAIYQGWLEIIDSSTVNGDMIQMLSPDNPFEYTTNRVLVINSTTGTQTNTYPNTKAVYDFVTQEVGNIETILNTLNVGSGVV